MVDEKNIITVSQLNNYVKLKLETDQGLSRLFVRGEISNLKTYGGTGHLYFTLKDERAQVSAVMFSSYTLNLKFLPKDGMKVIAIGKGEGPIDTARALFREICHDARGENAIR